MAAIGNSLVMNHYLSNVVIHTIRH